MTFQTTLTVKRVTVIIFQVRKIVKYSFFNRREKKVRTFAAVEVVAVVVVVAVVTVVGRLSSVATKTTLFPARDRTNRHRTDVSRDRDDRYRGAGRCIACPFRFFIQPLNLL